ncbi:MAG: SRPBCC family protein [Candidatus Cloacimonetes bacterium]|nr:SRPBCC family protein [Candidatus Cloacimonadota bacterium]
MSLMKRLVQGLGVLILVVVVVGLFLPRDYEVSRSIVIQASREAVHARVGELRAWPNWSPWLENDPTIVTTLGETTTGVGASQSWTSKEGPGELTFTECSLEQGIAYDMVFDNRHRSKGVMSYEDDPGGVRVTWGMTGRMELPVIGGYFCLLMDTMVGPMFDTGLSKLKTVVEAN